MFLASENSKVGGHTGVMWRLVFMGLPALEKRAFGQHLSKYLRSLLLVPAQGLNLSKTSVNSRLFSLVCIKILLWNR